MKMDKELKTAEITEDLVAFQWGLYIHGVHSDSV